APAECTPDQDQDPHEPSSPLLESSSSANIIAETGGSPGVDATIALIELAVPDAGTGTSPIERAGPTAAAAHQSAPAGEHPKERNEANPRESHDQTEVAPHPEASQDLELNLSLNLNRASSPLVPGPFPQEGIAMTIRPGPSPMEGDTTQIEQPALN